MNIMLNGEPLAVEGDALSLPALLERCGCAGRRVAFEVNGDVIPRSRHAQFSLGDGDRVEIIQAIGGG